MLFTIFVFQCHSAVPKFMQLKRARAELKYAAPKAKMILNVVFSIFHNNTWHTLHILSAVYKCLHVINYVVACNAGFCLAGKCKIFKTMQSAPIVYLSSCFENFLELQSKNNRRNIFHTSRNVHKTLDKTYPSRSNLSL